MNKEWREKMKWLIEDESGQSMVEYTFLLVFIAMLLVAAVGALGTSVAAKYEEMTNAWP